MEWIYLLLGVAVGGTIGAVLSMHKHKMEQQKRELAEALCQKQESQLRHEQSELEKTRAAHQLQREECARLESSMEVYKEHEQSLDARLEQAALKSMKALDGRYAERGKTELNATVKPLNEAFQQFREQLERQGRETTRERTTLVEGLKNVREMNESLAHEAQELAGALRRSPQVRGSWGEVQLIRVLEAAGLKEGMDYHVQKSYHDEDGNSLRPDVVIELPANRQVIIDSKLNIVDYLNAEEAKDEDSKAHHLKAHSAAMRKHVKDLAAKNYQDLPQVRSLDFVLMFIPVEDALAAALNEAPSLYDESLKMRVGLVTLNTLMPTLRIIENLWRTHRQQENTQKIVRQASSFYDKVNGVLKSTEELGKHLERSIKSHETVMNRLATGRGSLVSQTKQLEKLGIHGKKPLPETGTDDSLEATPALAEKASDEQQVAR